MPYVIKNRRKAGFSLIELLVVISIIALLMGLSFAGVNSALNSAKKAEASSMINSLVTALNQYHTDYNQWPSDLQNISTDQEVTSEDLYDLLRGEDQPTGDNPRRTGYMEFNSKVLRTGAAGPSNKTAVTDPTTADTFVDPWHNDYFIKVDSNYDGVLTDVPDTSANSGNTSASGSVAVWSTGGGTNQRKYITSY